MKAKKIYEKAKNNQANIRFSDIVIFVRDDVDELVNLQREGNKAKAYQVKQFLTIVGRYDLKLGDES
jgi:hypothetical protein